jgi:hypothetical protein
MIAPIKIILKQNSHYMFGQVLTFWQRDQRIPPNAARNLFDLYLIKWRTTLGYVLRLKRS